MGRASIELNIQFNKNGYKSILVSTKSKKYIKKIADVYQYPRIGPYRIYYSYALSRELVDVLGNFDVVHGHGFYVGTNYLFGLKCRKKNIPLVYHVHGIFEPWILNRSKWKKRIVHFLFEDANFKYASLWRALTNKEADQIRSQGIAAPIVIAPNGIHLDQFDCINESTIEGKTKNRMLFLARLHPKKGLDMLVAAWAGLGSLVKDWELLLAGPDENGHQKEIQSLIDEKGLKGSVKFIGTVTGSDKVALIKSSDLFVLPSYSEGFSVAILEAMACRIPVIATEACNFPEIATDGGGWECDVSVQGIQKSLAEAVCCGEDELKERGKLGRKLVEKKYQWPKIADDIINACNQYCK